MRYVFFDIECADGGKGSICSFGYVITDEHFHELESADIIINPESRFYLVGRSKRPDIILSYSEAEFRKAPKFPVYYQKIKALVLDKLSSGISDLDSDLMLKLELMTDVLTAATMGACHNYDIVMEKIYELNPDVTVVVINIQNLADDLVIDLDGAELPLGDIYGELIDLVNLYRAAESPYADQSLFADTGDVTTFLDEILAWNGDPTTLTGDMEDCFDMYDDSLFVRSIVEYMMVGQALSGLFDGFRKMAAQYGLEGVFANDDQYTYEFALTRSVEDLLSLDLSALDFANPGGSDQDIEEYGAAVSKHIKNLREETKNLEAYNYVFENLLTALQNQKTDNRYLLFEV